MIVKCTVAYDGQNYAGWQKQINALGIQTIIEEALEKIHKRKTDVVASGRTDAKVHALGQVFHFEADEAIEPSRYVPALNALLPLDIRILDAQAMPEDFHARFSCKSKRYMYIATYDRYDPFAYHYKGIIYQKLDMDAMVKGACYLIGEHDFTSFSNGRIDPRKPRVRNIKAITMEEKGKDIYFIFDGNGFLRYQVRMMVQTLIEVGRHSIAPEKVKEILDQRDKEACRYNAPAQGLYLVEVRY
ncbi:tRNA pseudouridine(38-40) synthase TruA [uncultured Faecalicoccus sp.]|uniref:tRNA pseudouridine(38-40) synthase TruA n=1 Tax=uncultured Faecalicoccus sp. TaxID=1971760 RepID=UPI002630D71E|nr:tRNA pseudouridine(38-40) synthase TruA [uncultured Faecalicoccus sp.]